MDIDFSTLTDYQRYKLMASLIGPRPIALVTTINADGVVNAAPFSMFNMLGEDPPILMISINKLKDGHLKDTAANILANREFVVHIADEPMAEQMHRCGERLPPGESELSASEISAQDLSVAITNNEVEVIDVDSSLKYRQGRIPGAWYALRSRLAECLMGFAKDRPLVFTSSNGLLAHFAAEDARRAGFNARFLKGGAAAWNHAGFKTEPSSGDADPKLLSTPEDIWYRPYDRAQGVEDAMQQYLTWEVGLVEQLKRETYLKFSV